MLGGARSARTGVRTLQAKVTMNTRERRTNSRQRPDITRGTRFLSARTHRGERTCSVRVASTAAWLALLALFPFTSVARADRVVPPTRIESSRGMALGSGVRAASASTQAQAENPANLVLGGLYHIESFFGYDPTFKRISVGGAVVDSMTSRLAAGISARSLFGDNNAGENSGWEGRIGLGFPIIDMLSIGVAGRYSNLTVSDTHAVPELRRDPLTGAPIVDGKPDRTFKLKAFTMDAALTLRPVQGLAISGLAYNMIDTESPLAPLMVGGSVAFTSEALTVGGDLLVDLNTHHAFDGAKLVIGGGGEYLVAGVVPLRVGYQYDQGRVQHSLSGGLGYVDPRFGVQLSLRQSLNQGSETSLFGVVQYFVR